MTDDQNLDWLNAFVAAQIRREAEASVRLDHDPRMQTYAVGLPPEPEEGPKPE